MKVLGYRMERGLSQRALAQQLGMKQPAIARLEVGDVTPSIDTLLRLSRGLGIDFHLDVTPAGVELTARSGRSAEEELTDPDGAAAQSTWRRECATSCRGAATALLAASRLT